MLDSLVLLSLVVVVATGTISGHQQIIYVDTQNGTLDNKCWDSGTVMPCANLELALEGAQKRQNAAVALLLKNNTYESRNSTGLIGVDTEQDVVLVHTSNNSSACPPWFVHSDDTNSSTCMCGNELGGVVICNSSLQESYILCFYCMTHDKYLGTVTGICSYNQWCFADRAHSSLHYRLPHSINISELNDAMCGRLNRTGRLCGRCKEGLSSPVYSYDLWCVECSILSIW